MKLAVANWKTTLCGIAAAGAHAVATNYPAYAPLAHVVEAMALAALGMVAQDKEPNQ